MGMRGVYFDLFAAKSFKQSDRNDSPYITAIAKSVIDNFRIRCVTSFADDG